MRILRARPSAVRAAFGVSLAILTIASGAGIGNAVEIPFEQLFYGRSRVSLIEDARFYPASYVSVQAQYWDLYYQREAYRLQDYHQSDQRIRGIVRRGPALLGFETNRMALTLKQDNVHSDADRMRGLRDQVESKVYLGYDLHSTRSRLLPSGIRYRE